MQMKSAVFKLGHPIPILSFFHNFKMACDSNEIHWRNGHVTVPICHEERHQSRFHTSSVCHGEWRTAKCRKANHRRSRRELLATHVRHRSRDTWSSGWNHELQKAWTVFCCKIFRSLVGESTRLWLCLWRSTSNGSFYWRSSWVSQNINEKLLEGGI